MKFNRYTMTLMAVAGLLSFSPALRAQTNTPPAARGPGGGGGGGRAGMRGTPEEQLTRLTEQLKLTDDQKPKVKAVIEDQNKQLQALRDLSQEDRRAKMPAIREENNKKMKAVLTADQFKKYEEMQQARRRNAAGAAGGAPGQNPNGGNAGGNQ